VFDTLQVALDNLDVLGCSFFNICQKNLKDITCLLLNQVLIALLNKLTQIEVFSIEYLISEKGAILVL
jgi:hypothetical protein